MADTSDAFFNSFSGSSPPAKTATQLNLKSKPRPPPPAADASTTTVGTSYYAAGAASAKPKTFRKGARSPPPPTSGTNGGEVPAATRPMRPRAPASTATATAGTASASSAGGGYYGASGYGASAPATATTNSNPYYQSTTAAAAAAATGYQYASAPVPAYNYGAPVPAAAPVPVPQVMNPYMLSATGVPAAAGGGFAESMNTGGFSGAMDTNAALSGPMDTSAPQQQMTMPQRSTFLPQAVDATAPIGTGYNPMEFEDEPPLMEELGVNVEHIAGKMRSVVLPFQRFGGNMDATVIQDADLAGPIILALLLGGELVLSGKFSFGYIYGFGMFGCVTMTLVLNFMSPNEAVSFWTVTSILGYSLLPVNLLAAIKLVVVNLGNLTTIGRLLGILTVIWCTVASTRLMEQGCDMRNQRYLIAYPIGLLYTAFVMITIF